MTPEGYGNKVGIKQGNTLCFVTQDMNPVPRSMHVAAVLFPPTHAHAHTHTYFSCKTMSAEHVHACIINTSLHFVSDE